LIPTVHEENYGKTSSTAFHCPKIAPYLGTGDPEAHLKAFVAQMLILGGFDTIRCKMFVGSLTGMELQWFSHIPDGTIDLFQTFSRLFLQQFLANHIKPRKWADLFDIRQKEENRFETYSTDFVGS